MPGDTPLLDPGEVAGAAAPRLDERHRRGDRAGPPRRGHQRAAAQPAGRDRAELRPRQLRAARGRRARGGRGARRRAGAHADARRGHRPGPASCWPRRSRGAAATRRPRAARCASSTARRPGAGRRCRPDAPRCSRAARSSALPDVRPATTSRRWSRRPRRPTSRDGDVLVIAHKVVSKAEGRVRSLDEIEPGERALALAAEHGKDAAAGAGGPGRVGRAAARPRRRVHLRDPPRLRVRERRRRPVERLAARASWSCCRWIPTSRRARLRAGSRRGARRAPGGRDLRLVRAALAARPDRRGDRAQPA